MVATLGGVVAVTALVAALAAMALLHRRAAQVVTGGIVPPAAVLGGAVDAPPFAVLLAVMTVCQSSAHVALLVAGVPSGMGEITGPVLHLVLAVAGAVLIWLAGRLVAAAAVSLTSAIAALLERLLADEEIPYPAPLSVPPRRHARGGAVHGRAPPLAA